MANKPSPFKIQLGVRFPIELHRKMLRKAKMMGISVSDFMFYYLSRAVADIQLTSDDYEKIAEYIKKKEAKERK